MRLDAEMFGREPCTVSGWKAKAHRDAIDLAKGRLAKTKRSSRARDARLLLTGVAPLTCAEIGGLDVTKRTASQAAATLEEAGLIAPTGCHEGLRVIALREP